MIATAAGFVLLDAWRPAREGPPAAASAAGDPASLPAPVHPEPAATGARPAAAAAELPAPQDPFRPLKAKPSSLSDHEWAAVQARAAAASDPGHEAARMADYIELQKRYLAWRAAAIGVDPAQRAAQGQAILDDLPAHVAEGTIALTQAQAMQVEILTARFPDAAERQPALDTERLRLPAQPKAAPFVLP